MRELLVSAAAVLLLACGLLFAATQVLDNVMGVIK